MEWLKIDNTLINMENIVAIDIEKKRNGVELVFMGTEKYMHRFYIEDVGIHETLDTFEEKYGIFNLPVKIRMRRHHWRPKGEK